MSHAYQLPVDWGHPENQNSHIAAQGHSYKQTFLSIAVSGLLGLLFLHTFTIEAVNVLFSALALAFPSVPPSGGNCVTLHPYVLNVFEMNEVQIYTYVIIISTL